MIWALALITVRLGHATRTGVRQRLAAIHNMTIPTLDGVTK